MEFCINSLGRCLFGGWCCWFCEAEDCLLTSPCTGAGLGATDDEAVEADGGREVTLFVGDFARPPSKEISWNWSRLLHCKYEAGQQDYALLRNALKLQSYLPEPPNFIFEQVCKHVKGGNLEKGNYKKFAIFSFECSNLLKNFEWIRTNKYLVKGNCNFFHDIEGTYLVTQCVRHWGSHWESE